MSEVTKRSIKAEDLYRFRLVSDCQISPDGRRVVFCVERVDRDSEKKFTNLWQVWTDDGRASQLTHGDQTDRHPRWSPDGETLAFISNRGDEDQFQIYLLPMTGGEARPLTAMKGSFDNFQWSPDGRELVCQFRKKDQEAIDREADPARKELGIVARHITRVLYKLDGAGYLPYERWHIWIFDVETGVGQQLTNGEICDEHSPCWSPDGRQIAFLSNRRPDPDLEPDAIDVFTIPAGGQVTEADFSCLETPPGEKALLSYSPDGRYLAFIGQDTPAGWWKNSGIWLAPLDGSGPVQDITAEYDIEVGNATLGDIADRPTFVPVWSADGRRIYFQAGQNGSTGLYSITHQGDDLRPEVSSAGGAGAFSLDKANDGLAFCFGGLADPGNIWFKELRQGESRQLTHFNERLVAEIDLGQIEEVWFQGADENRLQGWIVKPPGFDPGKRYPAILEIHGGPWLQYGNSFMHEFYYLAAQGYVVGFCNPRGGQGYGEKHSQAIENAWGTVDFADLMAFADLLADLAYVDQARMGVAGGSYGGYMTTLIIGRTQR
ncbi:MAG: S9 family peptidase, partial [Chloroflexota bacterium]